MNNERRLRPRTRTSPLMLSLLGALALAGIAGATPALAQANPTGPYVGATIGKPDWNATSIGGISGDTSGSAYKLYGGYRLGTNLAVELSGVRLGKLTGPLGEAKADGYAVDAVGMLPLSPTWTALGRVGVGQVKTSTSAGASDRNSAPKVGLGAQYQLNTNTALRGEWERYRIDAFGAKSNTDVYSLGVQVGF